MANALKPVLILIAALAPISTLTAQTAPPVPEVSTRAGHLIGPFDAATIIFAEQRYKARPLMVFADSPENPDFQRQMTMLRADLAELGARDVVIVTDTDPAAMTEWRRHIRPRGFSMVQLDKDFSPVFRKPMPSSAREVLRSIDKLESRRQEVSERFPSGR